MDEEWVCGNCKYGRGMGVWELSVWTRYGCVRTVSMDEVWVCVDCQFGRGMGVWGLSVLTRYVCVGTVSMDEVWVCGDCQSGRGNCSTFALPLGWHLKTSQQAPGRPSPTPDLTFN